MARQEGCWVIHLIRQQPVLAGAHHDAKKQRVSQGDELFDDSLWTQLQGLASEATPSAG